MFTKMLNPTGGVGYHLRALRRGNTWNPFIQKLNSMIQEWGTQCSDLILIGPSAGYCLDTESFKNFSKITALDLDPLAAKLFRWRHRANSVQWVRAKLTGKSNLSETLEAFDKIIKDQPKAAILFCNVLGQLPLLCPELEEPLVRNFFKTEIRKMIQGRDWMSFHDVLSTSSKPCKMDGIFSLPAHQNPNDIIFSLFQSRKKLEFSDHLSGELFADKDSLGLWWQFKPNRFHFIEVVKEKAL